MSEQGHILVVDDELGILDSVKRTLEREGLRVTTTDSGEVALDLLRRDDPIDVILADIMMPKMNGVELLRAVRAISPSVDVVMMTAFGTVENAVECMRAGAYDFITKPLKRAMFIRAVQRALERGALIRENANLGGWQAKKRGNHSPLAALRSLTPLRDPQDCTCARPDCI